MSLTSHHLVLFFINFADLVVVNSFNFRRFGPIRNPSSVKMRKSSVTRRYMS